MHLLISGSLIATTTALLTFPETQAFNAGLTGQFAQAIEASTNDCLASELVMSDSATLVLLNEAGEVTELTLFDVPDVASPEPTAVAMAMLEDEEDAEEFTITREVEVGLSFDSDGGKLDVTRDGEKRSFDIDSMDHASVAEILEHTGVGGDLTLSNLMEMLAQGDGKAHVEMIGEDGRRGRRVIALGDDDHGAVFRWEPRRGDQHTDHMHHRGEDMHPHGEDMHRHRDEMREHVAHHMRDMDDHEMMAQHMRFMQMMHHEPEAVMQMIEHLPPDMRDEHIEFIESMMHEGWEMHEPHRPHDPFMAESEQFVRKIMMSAEVAKVLNNREAVAIFGIWQARAHMEPQDRLVTLMPVAMSEHMTPAVQNAAMWVVMEAQAELGDMAGSRNSLTDLIKRNGRQ